MFFISKTKYIFCSFALELPSIEVNYGPLSIIIIARDYLFPLTSSKERVKVLLLIRKFNKSILSLHT